MEVTTKNAQDFPAVVDPLYSKFKAEKESGLEFQKRRHDQWRETYCFDRDIVHINALTQRQAVNIPIMKETKKTILARIDDAPSVFFDCLEEGADGRDKEIIVNELWNDDSDRLNFEAIDILEKSNVILYGRTFTVLNWKDGRFFCEVADNLDIVIDPKTSVTDIESARFFTRMHIFKTLKEVLSNEKYTEKGKGTLKTNLQSSLPGGVLTFTKDDSQNAKDQILQDLSITNFDELNAFDAQIELAEHYTNIWDDKAKKWVRYVQVWANESALLYNKPLKETLGVEFWPIISWAEDLDGKDFWNDGIGDTVRTPNKVANIYFSSMLENRAYNNLSMFWYLPVKDYTPQSFEPQPFGQYPAPLIKKDGGGYMGVDEVIRRMDIPKLDDSLISINFLTGLIEKATAATAIEKGVQEKGQATAFEINQLVQKSAERIVSMAKFYRRAWKEKAWKWLEINIANADEKNPIKLFKKSYDGNWYTKEVKPGDWISKKGYRVRVQSSSEQQTEDGDMVKKMIAVKQQMPENQALARIVAKRLVDYLKLTPDEIKEIENEQSQSPAITQEEQPNGQPAQISPQAMRLKNSTSQLKELAQQI